MSRAACFQDIREKLMYQLVHKTSAFKKYFVLHALIIKISP